MSSLAIFEAIFQALSVFKQIKIYSLYNEVRKNLEINHKTPNIERLYKQSVDINIRLNDLIKNNQEPFFQKDKYIYLSQLNQKLNNFIILYQKLLELMTENGVSKKDIDSFIRNKENNSYRMQFKRDGLDIEDILKQVDEIIYHIKN